MRHVVIIGGGFGGLRAARELKGAPVNVTLIDRRNHHLFQPLLYQVATAGLSPADIASPIRSVLSRQENVEVLMAEVVGVDKDRKVVRTRDREVRYDDLVIATGSTHGYFGHDDWERVAPGLKSINDATRIRRKVLMAFEQAEMETDPEIQKAYLNFVIVGGGPTGVEMAGSISELARKALRKDFRHIDPTLAGIRIIEAGPRILATFPEKLSARAARYLEKRNVVISTGSRVERIDADGVVVSGTRIVSKTVIWAAGVMASPAARWLEAEADRMGKVKVEPDLTLPGHPEIFVIGDTAAATRDGKPLPGLAPVAMQQGSYVAQAIWTRGEAAEKGEPVPERFEPFRYVDKGNLATVGRSFAVADLGWIQLSGRIAWAAWLVVHVYYLISFRNRLLVLLQWAWAYVTFQRGARLITPRQTE